MNGPTAILRRIRSQRLAWRRDEGGASTVEFAIITPVFLLMAAFMVNGGLALYAHSTIVSHAREAVRGVALGYMTKEEAENFARQKTSDDLGVAAFVELQVFDPAVDPDVNMLIRIGNDEMAKFAPFSTLMPFEISTRIVMRQVQ